MVVALLVFTEPGQRIWSAGVDLVTGRAEESATDRIEEQQLRERLRGIEPLCNSDYRPNGFTVSEGQAIALAAGGRNIACDLVETEPMGGGAVDRVTWAVHVNSKKPGGCEFSAVIDGKTGEKIEDGGGCP